MTDFIFNYIFQGLSAGFGNIVLIAAGVSLLLLAVFLIIDFDIWYSILFAGMPLYLFGMYQILTVPYVNAVIVLVATLILTFAFYRIFWR